MAYRTEELLEKALVAIAKHRLFFIEDVVAYLPCSKPTFYEHKLNEVNDLMQALENNRIEVKVSLRSKWYQSRNPLLQLALYKLIGTEEEYHRIASTKTQSDINLKNEVAPFQPIDLDVPKDNGPEENSGT